MDEPKDFATTLRMLMTHVRRSNRDLAELTGIPLATLENWSAGAVRRPRSILDVLKVARALTLGALDTDTFLQAAGYPALAHLQEQVVLHDNAALRELLRYWSSPTAAPSITTEQHPIPLRPQLRLPVADFVGRQEETARLVQALSTARAANSGAIISAVQGMGGVGKTELAYHVAHQLRDIFPDAQIFLNLRGSSATPLTAEQALQTVIHTLTPDVPLPADQAALQQRYCSVLNGRRALILADDAGNAAQVRALIPPFECGLLITSRQRFTLPGMTIVHLEQLDIDAAIALLHTICPRLSAAEAQEIARACGLLPLALRISASILYNNPALDVATYLARLVDSHQCLTHLRDPDDDQLDVEASLALSYTQLDSSAQQVLRQIGVFVADFDTSLAQAVLAADQEGDITAILHRLLRRNLVMYDACRARWHVHDLVRAFALCRLEQAGEADATRWRYARAVMHLVHELQRLYLAGNDNVLIALARFDAEHPHLESIRRWAMSHAGTTAGDTLLLEDAQATNHIGLVRYDRRTERIPQLETARAAAHRLGDQRSEGHILNRLGIAFAELGKARQAALYFEQALAIARAIEDQAGEATALTNLGGNHHLLGNVRQAVHTYEQALAIFRTLGDRRSEGHTLGNLGSAYHFLGNVRRAISVYKQALVLAQEVGNRYNEGNTLGNLGLAYMHLGDISQATMYDEQALSLFRAMGNRRGEAEVLDNLGQAYASIGAAQHAISCYEQALTIAREIGDRRSEGVTLGNLGEVYGTRRDAQQAIECGERSLALMREVGDRRMEGYALLSLGCIYVALDQHADALPMFEQAHEIFQAVEDRYGEARCRWHYGLALTSQGASERGLSFLRMSVVYQREIGHTKADEHAALIASMGTARALEL